MTLNDIVGTSTVKSQTTLAPTPGATINLTVIAGQDTVAKWTAGEAETVNISSGTPSIGDEFTAIIVNDGTLARTITLGTLLTNVGVIVGVLNKTTIIKFVGDGSGFIEASRTVGI